MTAQKRFPLLLVAFMAITSISFSQTGPGGVGNATGASGQPKNVIWLRSGSGISQSGGTVDVWADQSGNGFNALGTGGTKPAFVASDANFNNQPSINFSPTGTNNHLRIADNDQLDNTTGLTMFSVFRATDVSGDKGLVSKRISTGTDQSYMMWINTGDLTSRIEGDNAAPNVNTFAANSTNIGSVVFNGTVANPRIFNYVNGNFILSANGPASITNNASDVHIGAFDVSGGETRNLAGNISEVLIYTSSLNAAQRQIVENYLSAKYAVTTAADVYAGDTGGNGNRDFDVIGIGRASGTTHTEANSSGFILSTYNGTLDVDGEFVMAGHNGAANSVSVSNLGVGVQQRWARAWYVDKTTAGTLDAAISFDFSDGISGQFPQDKDDYELLRFDGVNYSIVTIASGDKLISGDRITFRVTNASLTDGVYTLGTTNLTDSPVNGAANRTWYSYQTGNWESPTSWTLDGGVIPLYVNPGSETPAASDNVVVNSGRTITITTNTKVVNNVEVNGILNVAATSGHSFLNIAGTGRIRISGAAGIDNFPSGSTTDFADATTGGTVEVYGTGLTLSQNHIFNDLIINLSSGIASLTASTITLNGDLEVDNGTLRFNDGVVGTPSSLTVNGNVTVASTGSMTVSTSNLRHQFNFYGDLTNDGGVIHFTNRVTAAYTTEAANGIVDANFLSGTKNQTIVCNGVTRFYRIEIDKGTDDTYLATFTANAVSNFLLFGYSNDDHASIAQLTASNNAFALLRGTAEIRTNISIPVLSNNGNYNVSAGATLWVNGGTVLKNNGNSLVPYGKVKISAGLLESKVNAGITTRDNGTIIVEGGILNTNQIRTSVLGASNVGGYVQTNGTVTVDGGGPGGTGLDYYVFSLTYTGNVFQMSGGTLIVKGARAGTNATRGGIFINSDPANVSVTGGTVIAEISNGNPYVLTSRAPFWNLILRNTFDATVREIDILGGTSGPNGGGLDEITLTAQNLVVKGGLTIENNVLFDHNGKNLNIAGNLTIQQTGDLLFSTNVAKRNTTTLDGSDNAVLTFLNHFSTGAGDEQRFWNLAINKPTDKVVTLESGKADRTGNNNNLVRIDGTSFKLLSGTVNQGSHSIRMFCDSLVNYGTLGLYTAGVGNDNNPNGTNDLIKLRDDNNPTKFLTTSSAVFGPVRLNSGDDAIELVSDVYIRYLQYQFGKINLGTHNLKIDALDEALTNNADSLTGVNGVRKFSVEDMLVTSGNTSDGGLSLYVPVGTANGTMFTFPLGLGTSANDVANTPGTDKYTPAYLYLSNVTDDGYVTINPVNSVLQTTNLGGGTSILSYHWRVRHSGFSAVPTVSYEFTYNNVDVGGTEANYVPGKVLDFGLFTRSFENSTAKVIDAQNTIKFNGSGTGFPLENANYTAGATTRFTGSVEVYYTKRYTTVDYSIGWNSTTYWTLATNDIDGNGTVDADEVHDSRQPNAVSYPQVGDIAVIGWVPWGDPAGNNGRPHGIAVNGTETVAELRFTQMLDNGGNPVDRDFVTNFHFRPNVVLNNAGTQGQFASGAKVSGEGSFWVRSVGGNLSDPAFTGVDLGDFNQQDSSYFVYESTLANATYVNVPAELPNVIFTTDNWGAEDKTSTVSKDITVNGNLELLGDVNFVLSTGANGNITVMNNFVLFRSNANGNDSGGGGELRFGNTGTPRTITIFGDLKVGNGSFAGQPGFVVRVNAPNGTPTTHTINLYGNYSQNTTGNNTAVAPNGNGLKLGNNSANDRIHLNLLGTNSKTFTSSNGDVPELYSLTVNKGSSIATTTTFTTNFTLNGPTNLATKSLVLQNGLVVLSNASIALNLSTGGGDFSIPASAGLQVTNGTVNLTGSDTGLLLDGLLRVSGGTVNIDDAVGNGNNFIEYSASGSAVLEITSGTLTVGSQIRRGLTSTTGILKYRQSGGTVIVGRRAAPTTSRGVFEVVNNGSEFTHSAGTLTLVRGINSTTVPSLLLEPQTPASIINSGSTIVIGNVNTPSGVNGQNIGIKSSKRLGNLTISNASGNSPKALIYSSPLTIDGNIVIANNATLDAQGFGLTLRGNFEVNGRFTANGNTTTFSSSSARDILGTGVIEFFNFSKNAIGSLRLFDDITVLNDLRILAGTLTDNGNSITLHGNAYFGNAPSTSGAHASTLGGQGIIFAGSSQQQLFALRTDGVAALGTVTINNPNGVIVADQSDKFTINTELRLERGVFDIGGSLLTLATGAEIEEVNTFSVTNMIQTNSSFTDNGMTKNFAASRTTNFIFPIGQLLYTPVSFNFSDVGHTTGSTPASITVRPANERQPTIIDDVESGLCSTPINDLTNVLQYHWIITAANVATNFETDMVLKYDQTLVADNNGPFETDYLAARVLTLGNTVGKFPGDVNAVTNEIIFRFSGVNQTGISGEYFAGEDCAIPDNVPVYTTLGGGAGSGSVSDLSIYSGSPSTLPVGAVLIVSAGDVVDIDVNNVSLYRTEIYGTLRVESGTLGNRLGTVVGDGTLRLEVNAPDLSVVLPAGFYNDFFSCSGGGLALGGNTSYEVLGGITSLRRLVVDGTGSRSLANNDLVICEDLTVSGATFLNPNNRNISVQRDLIINSGTFSSGINNTIEVDRDLLVAGGTFSGQTAGAKIVNDDLIVSSGTFTAGSGGTLTLLGDLTFSGGTFSGGTGTHRTIFQGTTAQNKTGNITFNALEIDNALGLTLAGTTAITSELLLTNGNITTASNPFTLGLTTTVTPNGGQETSFVDGRLSKLIAQGGSFVFPIGRVSRWRTASVINPTAVATTTWEFEYIIGSPTDDALVDNLTPSSGTIKTISSGEYWKVSTGVTSNTATIGLSWGIESDVNANAVEREDLVVMLWNDGTSLWNSRGGTNFIGGHTQSRGSFNASSTISFSEQIVTLGSTDESNPLPVELVAFTGKHENGFNKLEWKTASELNNDYFELERSSNGEEFASIGRIAGKGTTSELSDYVFLDEQPLGGTNYYRLKQVDFNGEFSYSNIVLVEFEVESGTFNVSVFPNPVAKGTSFTIRTLKDNEHQATVTISDLTGRQLVSYTTEGTSGVFEKTIDLQTWTNASIYIVEMKQGNKRVFRRVLID